MRRMALLGCAVVALAAVVATAAYGGVGLNTTSSSGTAAGQPVATDDLLCGLWTQGSDRVSGQSSIDHPSGASSMGQQYDYTGQNCENEYNGLGGFSQGSGSYSWTVSHSNVNVDSERGTEHAAYALSADGRRVGGA